jgi:Tfp pilus assembly protein PilF
MYPDDPARRARRRRITIALALAVLLAAFIVTRSTTTKPSAMPRAAVLVREAQNAYADGDYATARTRLTQAQRLDPRNPSAHFYLGLIMQIVDNNAAGAEAQYREAITEKPQFARALFNLGVLRAKAGATAEALDLYRRAVAADDRLAAAHFNLGLLLRAGDPNSQEAVSELQRAVVLDPSLAKRIPDDTTTTTSTTVNRR